ncbi:MAG: phosphatidate cytidylyltransferase [Candidatus Midichloria sp.]|nr:MAG: phosphatidate cytidylyltransferase [Candidatus Midichloria sp.]
MVNSKNKKMPEVIKKFLKADILKRSLSALILLPLFLFALYKGGLPYSILIIVLGFIIIYEWFSIVYRAKSNIIKPKKKYKWYFFGIIYSLLTAISILFLRNQPSIKFAFDYKLLLWICIIVWTTDIAAYFVGITVEGPKILPRVSPSKTWSGCFGALVFSVLSHEVAIRTVVTELFNPQINIFVTWGVVILTSLISQIGDFAESAFKRHFQVKNSSHIIPGHGGVMDRVDGLVMVCIMWFIVFVLSIIFNF